MEHAGGELIGRTSEWAALTEALDAADRRRGTVVLLRGEAGIGKTRLLDEAVRAAADRGFAAAVGRAWEGEGAPTWWPWIEASRSLGGAEGSSPFTAPLDGAGSTAAAARFAVFDAVGRWLRERAADRPVLIAVDDLHWADEASVELLGFLARTLRDVPVVLAASYRPDELEAASLAVVAQASRDGADVDVSPLDPDDSVRLAHVVAPRALVGDQPATVARLAGGNPFLVRELARLLAGDDHVERSLLDGLSPAARDVVGRRLARLPDHTLAVLQGLAVAGPEADLDVLAAMVGIDVAAVADRLRPAGADALVRWSGRVVGFVHALTREAVLASIGDTAAAQLHADAALAIEAVHGGHHPEWLGRVADHRFEARSTLPVADVLESVRAAAELAERQHGHGEAVAMWGRAVRLVRTVDAKHDLADTLLRLAEAANRARRLEMAEGAAVEAVALAEALGDPVLQATAALAMPPHFEMVEVPEFRDTRQVEVLEAALAAVDGLDAELACRLRAKLAVALYWWESTGRRVDDWRATAARRDSLTADALTAARRLGRPATLAHALASRILACWGPDSDAERPELVDELSTVTAELADVELVALATAWRIKRALETWDLTAFVDEVDRFARLAERTRQPLHEWMLAKWETMRSCLWGRLDEAEVRAMAAFEAGVPVLGRDVSFHFYATLIGCLRHLQDRTAEVHESAVALADELPLVPAWRVALVSTYPAVGDMDAAMAEFAWVAADDYERLPRDLNFGVMMGIVAQGVVTAADPAAAATHHPACLPFAGQGIHQGLGNGTYGPMDRLLGQMAALAGDLDAARRHLEDARRATRGDGDVFEATVALDLAALLRRVGGDPDRARRLDALGQGLLDGFGMAPYLERQRAIAVAIHGGPNGGTSALLARDGQVWRVGFGSTDAAVPDLKGFAQLAHLLARPGEEVEAVLLAGAVGGASRQAVIDEDARRAYAARLRDLDDEIDDAGAAADEGRRQVAVVERDRLLDELAAVSGIGGRDRGFADAVERARVSVTKTVRSAIVRLDEVLPAAADHLRRSVHTGARCRYVPAEPVTWTVRR